MRHLSFIAIPDVLSHSVCQYNFKWNKHIVNILLDIHA